MKQKIYSKSVTVAKETEHIKAVAEKLGIVLPSTHTALFQSVFAPLDEANLNGHRLDSKIVDVEIKKMIGAQANLEHMGYGWIVGVILDAWVNDSNEIEIIYSFAKNIYKDEYVLALEAMANGDLAVSFELDAEIAGQEKLADGTLLLHDYSFTGVGVLIQNPPAYANAKTYEFANAIKDRLQESTNKEFVFASQLEKTCDNVLSNTNEKTETPALTESKIDSDKNDIKDKDLENKTSKEGGNTKMELTKEQKAEIENLRAELGDLAKDVSDEELLDETIVAELRTKAEEARVTQLAYQVDVVEVRTYSLVEKDGVDTIKETVEIVKRIDYNSQLAAVAKVEELEATLSAKDSEIESVRENAEKVGKAKVELKDNTFAADFTDEDYLDDVKVAKAIQDKTDAEVIATRKEELKDNKYATDFSDEDYLDETKVELAVVKAEKDELVAKVPAEEVVATTVVEKPTPMNAGVKTETTDENKSVEVMASIRKANKDGREAIKVYTK
jgi:hypothetical protein